MITLKINGQDHSLRRRRSVPLLWVIRDELGLTGTKFGCGKGLCGACTVHLDGVAVRSCQCRSPTRTARAWSPSRASTRTAIIRCSGRGARPARRNAATAMRGRSCRLRRLLAVTPKPTDDDILSAMSGNICRCGCYQRIAEAVRLASTGV